MIFACELSFEDAAHVPFNAGLLATIRAAFPKEELSFFGAATHIQELKKEIGEPLADSIAWRGISLPTAGTGYLKRFFRELKVIRRLLKSVPEDSTSRLLLTSARPSTVLALKIGRCFRCNHLPVQIVLHGMSGVVGKRQRSPIRRFQDMRTALTLFRNRNIQYLVLEQSIRDTVLKHVPFLSGRLEALDHPISPKEAESESIDLSEPIRFGFLGLANEAKGFPVFVKAANHVAAKYGRRVEFHAIGRCPQDEPRMDQAEILETKPADKRMTRADFIRGVTRLHFIILPHEAGSYRLSASGVLLDAIAWQKPVIARKIPIFEAIFEKHGDIGYLFSDDCELTGIVEQIFTTADNLRYRTQVLNLRSARKSRAPETLAGAYREICDRGLWRQ
jgi:hypothetical protein